MNKPSKHLQPWRVLWLIPVAVLAAVSIIATGGGSGGGNGTDFDDVDPPLVILPNYNFFLGNLNNGAPLTVVVVNHSLPRSISTAFSRATSTWASMPIIW